jgi:SEC-C motif
MPSDRVPRNAPCPCGSGRKFKHCCGQKRSGSGAGDAPLFPGATPERARRAMVLAMRAAGVDPALIHAFERTGLVVGDDNLHLIPPEAMVEWEAAVEEYRRGAIGGRPTDFPLATVALYGPDDRTATKLVAAVFPYDGAEPVLARWVATDLDTNLKVQEECAAFLKEHGAKRVVTVPDILGCPHEEGEDFPEGADCPFCPFWRGKQGTARRDG